MSQNSLYPIADPSCTFRVTKDFFVVNICIAPPFLKISVNEFFATNRKINNLELGRDRFFNFDLLLKIFSDTQIL